MFEIFRLRRFAGYFGDLGDGVHKGDVNDPRVALIEVIPEEIQYWISKQGVVGRTVEAAAAALTGKGHAPGELRTISMLEVRIIAIENGIPNNLTSDRSNSPKTSIRNEIFNQVGGK